MVLECATVLAPRSKENLWSLLLRPVSIFFNHRTTRVENKERAAAQDYLRRALGREPGRRDLWRQLWTFSQVQLDRLFILGADARGVELRAGNPAVLHEALDQGRGCLLLGSHLGSFEASRAVKRQRPEVLLRLVMDRGHSPAATRFLEALSPELVAEVVDIGLEVAEDLDGRLLLRPRGRHRQGG